MTQYPDALASRSQPIYGQRSRLGQACLTVSYPDSGIHRGALIPFRVNVHNEGAYTAQQVRVLINLPPGLGLLAGMLGFDGRRALRTKEIIDEKGHCVSAIIGTVEPRETVSLRGTFVVAADLPTSEQRFAVRVGVSADDLPDEVLETTLTVGNGSATGSTSAIVWSRPVAVAPPSAVVLPLRRSVSKPPELASEVLAPSLSIAQPVIDEVAAAPPAPVPAVTIQTPAPEAAPQSDRRRLRRAFLVACKVAGMQRMGWWKHVLVLRALSPDAIDGTHEANAAYRSAIDAMDHALARAYMALFAPDFSPTPEWIATLYAADSPIDDDLRSAHALGAQLHLPTGTGAGLIEAVLPRLPLVGVGSADVDVALAMYRAQLAETFGQDRFRLLEETARRRRLSAMPNPQLDEALLRVVSRLPDPSRGVLS